MYDVQEDASSDHHAYFEKAASSLNPPVILKELAKKRFGAPSRMFDVQVHQQN